MARKRAAGNGDNEENVPAAKKARVEPLKLAIAFAWGNKKFSDAQIKIFEEDIDPPKRRSSRRAPKRDAGGLDDEDSFEVLHVSKVVLGGCSDFFQRMFDSGMIEDSQSIAELRVKVGQKEACKDAIRYVYLSEFENTSHEHLLNVVSLAHRFDLIPVAKAACETLVESVPVVSDADVRSSESKDDDNEEKRRSVDELRAEIYEALLSMPEQIREADWFIPVLSSIHKNLVVRYSNLKSLWTRKDFACLGGRSLARVLSSESLLLESEEDAFIVFSEWITEASHVDEESVRCVINALRFPCMKRRYLRFFVRHCRCPGEDLLHQKVEDALDIMALVDSEKAAVINSLCISDRIKCTPRPGIRLSQNRQGAGFPMAQRIREWQLLLEDGRSEHYTSYTSRMTMMEGLLFRVELHFCGPTNAILFICIEIPDVVKSVSWKKLTGELVMKGICADHIIHDFRGRFVAETIGHCILLPKVEFERPENFDVDAYCLSWAVRY